MTPDGIPFTTHAADGFPVAAWRILSVRAYEKSYDLQGKTRRELMFAHATGFCGAAWRPVLSLLADHNSLTFDFRGHGASPSSRTIRSWWEMAADVLGVARESSAGIVGIGHSMGGASLVMAEILRPGTFAALVLIEPIIFPGPYGRNPDHPLVALALRRRDRFESREALHAAYSSKPPFDSWHPDALAGYLDGGFVSDPTGVRLACPPVAEAEVFTAASAHAAWERLGEVSVPVTILYGADTDTYPTGHGEALAARFAVGEVHRIAGTGHFLPMERPDVVAEEVRSTAASLS